MLTIHPQAEEDLIVRLRAQRDPILARWLEAARRLPCHQQHPDSAVSDHIPGLLDALFRALDGALVDDDAGHAAAIAHARVQAAQGLASADVVTEFRLLRRELQRALITCAEGTDGGILELELRLHDGLDTLIASILRTFDTLARTQAGSLLALERVAHEISALRPLDETLSLICERARDLLAADNALLALPGPDGALRLRAGSGAALPALPSAPIGPGAGITGRAYAAAAPVTTTMEGTDETMVPAPLEQAGGMESMLAVPLRRGAAVVGTLSVGALTPRQWTADAVAMLEALAAQAAVAVDNARLYEVIDRRQRLFDHVVRGAPALLAVVRGADHRYELVNPRFQGLAPSVPLVGKAAADTVPELQEQGWVMHLDRAREGEPVLVENMVLRPLDVEAGAERRYFTLSLVPLRGTIDEEAGVLIVGHETTEAVARQKRRDEFVSRACHELLTPLTGARGLLQLALRRLPDEHERARVQSWLELALKQVDRLGVLVEDLREIGRMQASRLRLRLAILDVRDLIEQSARSLQTTTEKHTLHIELPTAPAPVFGDHIRILQVIDNLLSNAVKYSPRGGDVLATCTLEDGAVLLDVRDQGIGIPEGERARVFEPFHRGANSHGNPGGMGLGLYISREIARQHGGDLELLASGPDGSAFRLRLPRQRKLHTTEAGSAG